MPLGAAWSLLLQVRKLFFVLLRIGLNGSGQIGGESGEKKDGGETLFIP
jgi:hypothetical protein